MLNGMMLTTIIYIASLLDVVQRCHSFKQVKRRFKPRSFVSRHHITPLRKYYISARGGDISDDYGTDDNTFSHFIESFESELSEIRREAEIEAELEMQKLLGLVDRSSIRDEDVTEKEIYVDEEQSKLHEAVHDESEEGNIEIGGLDAQATDEMENREEIIDEYGIDDRENESDLSGNEQDASESVLPIDEEETYDLDEGSNEDVTVSMAEENVISLDEEHHLRTGKDISQDIAETDPPQSVDTNLDVSDVDTVTKVKLKKQKKSKSKKTRASKAKTSKINNESLTGEHDEHAHSHGLSNVSVTKQKDVETTKSGLQFYLQSDLVRAVLLFIATIAVSIWLQRLQKQMEAAGI